MSFLLDPPLLLLFGAGLAILAPRLPGRHPLPAGFAAILALFWGVSLPLCYDLLDIPFHGYPRGSDFCLNSWMFHGLARSPTADLLGALLFAAYPAWLYLGVQGGKRMLRHGEGGPS